MTVFCVHSHNLRGSLKSTADWTMETMASCECTALLLQDVGPTGPEGQSILKSRLEEDGHFICANCSNHNKSRSVMIIVHK